MTRRTSRRAFLREGLAAGAGLLAARSALAADAEEPRMHIGLVTYMVGAKMDLPTLIKACEDSGMEGVELRSTHKHGVEPSLDAEARAKVREQFAKTKVKLVGLGSACEYHSPDPKVVKRNIELTNRFVQLAADLGAWGVKIRPNRILKDVPEDKTLRQIAGAIRECAQFAADKKIMLFVECHGRGTSEPARMAKIMEHCDHPSACLCWNCNGIDVKNGSIRETFGLCQRWVRHIHIHDLSQGYPYAELFGMLKAMKFTGYTMNEAHCKGDPIAYLKEQRALWEKLAL